MSDRTTAISAASSVLQSLPGQFLALVILNAAFIGGMLWFLQGVDSRRVTFEQSQNEARERVLVPLLNACIQQVPVAALQHLQQQQKQP
jgi:hypothetical protein